MRTIGLLLLTAATLAAAEDRKVIPIGVDEKLGETIPLDLPLIDEEGSELKLGDLFDKPVVLTLIYLRCPSICSPLINGLADTVDELKEMRPPKDYRLITVSFDNTDLNKLDNARKGLLSRMATKPSLDAWRFLTGPQESIDRLTDAVGFRYKKEGQDFIHPGTVIFLSKDGKIVRYLAGVSTRSGKDDDFAFLPSDMKFALMDASEGIYHEFIPQIVRTCYTFDPASRRYVFNVNKLILFGTLFLAGIFLAILLLKKPKKAPVTPEPEEAP